MRAESAPFVICSWGLLSLLGFLTLNPLPKPRHSLPGLALFFGCQISLSLERNSWSPIKLGAPSPRLPASGTSPPRGISQLCFRTICLSVFSLDYEIFGAGAFISMSFVCIVCPPRVSTLCRVGWRSSEQAVESSRLAPSCFLQSCASFPVLRNLTERKF